MLVRFQIIESTCVQAQLRRLQNHNVFTKDLETVSLFDTLKRVVFIFKRFNPQHYRKQAQLIYLLSRGEQHFQD